MTEAMTEAEEPKKEGLPEGFFQTEVFSMTPDPKARGRKIPGSEDDEG